MYDTIAMPHKSILNTCREYIFIFGKNAFSTFAFSVSVRRFVWQQKGAVHFSCVASLRLHTFLFYGGKRDEESNIPVVSAMYSIILI